MKLGRRAFLRSIAATAAAKGVLPAFGRGLAGHAQRRPFGWEDAYNRTDVNSVALSADGEAVALEVTRPLSAHGAFLAPAWLSLLNPRGDLWLLNGELGAPKQMNVLPGGAWSPGFSPDGKRLAALSLVGPGRVGLAVWELDSGTCRTFSACNVEIFLAKFRTAHSAYGGPSGLFQVPRQYSWLDAKSILYVDYGAARQQSLLAISSLSPTLRSLRERTEEGELSVRVWNDRSPTCGAGSRLARIACDTGRSETLYEGDVRGVSLSPDGRWLAVVVATGNAPPAADERMEWPLLVTTPFDDPMVYLQLTLIDLLRPGRVHEVKGVTGVGNVAPSRLPLWSWDSSRVAIPVRETYSDAPSTGDDAVWEVAVNTGDARKRSASSALDAELVAALITTDGLNTQRVIDERPRKIRSNDYIAGGQISGGAWRCARRHVMFWNAPTLTIIGPNRSTTIQGNFTLVQPPAVENTVGRTIAVCADGLTSAITTRDDGGYTMEGVKSEPGWHLLGVRPRDAAVVYEESSDRGTFLLLAKPGKRPRTSPLRFNTYFCSVLRPQRRMLTLAFPDGTVRKGTFVLPIGHKNGQSYPVIVWAYPDSTPSLNEDFIKLNDWNSVFRPIQYLLTRGFAFFHAPFPIGEASGKSNRAPMHAATNAVIPWLDVLDRQPEVIPGECGFFGHSNAGYVALALEALTRRFKAIVAWDTFPEIGFDTLHSELTDVALHCAGNVIQSERMYYEDPMQPYAPQPAPPWRNSAAFIRNDPLFNLNRAATPLLLLEGEFDSDPREMEEVYAILRGRGVPVELAYYWGEEHVFSSPGNIHDSWLRTEAFFNRYLARR